jgi:hypothetical protein
MEDKTTKLKKRKKEVRRGGEGIGEGREERGGYKEIAENREGGQTFDSDCKPAALVPQSHSLNSGSVRAAHDVLFGLRVKDMRNRT